MDLNGITCENYSQQGNRFEAILTNTDISKISELDGQTLCITKSETDKTYFGGYTIVGIDMYEGSRYLVRFLKSVSDLTEQAINAANGNIDVLNEKMEVVEQDILTNTETMSSLSMMGMYTMPTIAPTIKDSAIVTLNSFAPEWKTNHEYKKGEFITYNDRYFRVSQDHTSQDTWHPGDEGTEALYYEIVIAPDGIIVWKQPTGEYDAPDKGDARHYPDADSPIYISTIDNNSYSPDTYPQGWELQEG